ncbi:MAG: TetR/AcrR family transcriptional regulator [Candidatus Promineifilaceae bacterium]
MIENNQLELTSLENIQTAHERADAAANRRLILQTAEHLYAERGVAAVTMADIAAAAGVGKGTLYRRFDNKAELTLALLDGRTREFQNGVLKQLNQFEEGRASYLDRLDYYLDALVHFTNDHLPYLCVVQSEGLIDDREQSHPYHWQHHTVNALLSRGIAAGELLPSIDVPYTADALLAPLRADIFRYQRAVRGFTPDRISHALRTLLHALST